MIAEPCNAPKAWNRLEMTWRSLSSSASEKANRPPGCEWIRMMVDSVGSARSIACSRYSPGQVIRSEEHTSELQSLMRISYAVLCLKQKNNIHQIQYIHRKDNV